MNAPDLQKLLEDAGLSDKVARVHDNLWRLQWGSAFVIVAISGSAIVAIAPLFRAVPAGKEQAFYRKLLEHNAHMGGMANFAMPERIRKVRARPDSWLMPPPAPR